MNVIYKEMFDKLKNKHGDEYGAELFFNLMKSFTKKDTLLLAVKKVNNHLSRDDAFKMTAKFKEVYNRIYFDYSDGSFLDNFFKNSFTGLELYSFTKMSKATFMKEVKGLFNKKDTNALGYPYIEIEDKHSPRYEFSEYMPTATFMLAKDGLYNNSRNRMYDFQKLEADTLDYLYKYDRGDLFDEERTLKATILEVLAEDLY